MMRIEVTRLRARGVRFAALAAISAAIMLGAAACGSDESSGGDADSIKLGVLLDQTGPAASYGQAALKGIELRVDEVNADGGIDGRQVEIDSEDAGGTKETAVALIRQLASNEEVLGLIGPTRTDSLLTTIPISNQLEIPSIAPSSRGPITSDFGDYVFRVAPPPSAVWPTLMEAIVEREGIESVAVLYARDDPAMVGEKDAVEAAAQDAGVEVLEEKSFTTGDTSFLAQLTEMRGEGPDLVVLASTADDGAVILRQMGQAGLQPDVTAGVAGMNDPGWLENAGGNGIGFLSVGFSPKSSDPVVSRFVKDYRAEYGDEEISVDSVFGYDAAGVMLDAIERAGESADRTAITEKLGITEGFEGASGPIGYDGSGDRLPTEDVPIIEMTRQGFVPWQ